MKKVHVSTLMLILFFATLVSFSYAGASCCDPGAGCYSTPNISGGQQPRASSGTPSYAEVGTANKPAAQINPMPWSATVNQSGNPQRLLPPVSTGAPGTRCCPGTNTTNGCCAGQPESALPPSPDSLSKEQPTPSASLITEIFAVGPSLGTLW